MGWNNPKHVERDYGDGRVATLRPLSALDFARYSGLPFAMLRQGQEGVTQAFNELSGEQFAQMVIGVCRAGMVRPKLVDTIPDGGGEDEYTTPEMIPDLLMQIFNDIVEASNLSEGAAEEARQFPG